MYILFFEEFLTENLWIRLIDWINVFYFVYSSANGKRVAIFNMSKNIKLSLVLWTSKADRANWNNKYFYNLVLLKNIANVKPLTAIYPSEKNVINHVVYFENMKYENMIPIVIWICEWITSLLTYIMISVLIIIHYFRCRKILFTFFS